MTVRQFHNGRVTLHQGDCLTVLDSLPDSSVDSVVCDPPYHLTSIVKRFGGNNAAPCKVGAGDNATGAYARASAGFMGKQWDGGDIAFRAETWAKVWRVLKPGGHLVAFSGTRTYHRMTVAIEDAGFEIRDMLSYLYGTGFPKSHNVSKKVDRCVCLCPAPLPERDLRSVRQCDVPQAEHSQSEQGQVLFSGVQEQGASVEGMQRAAAAKGAPQSCVEGGRHASPEARELCERSLRSMPSRTAKHGESGRVCDGTPSCDGAMGEASFDADGVRASSGSQPAEQRAGQSGTMAGQPQPQTRGAWPVCERCSKPIIPDGLGTALKPACEPVAFARKPLSEGTVAANVLAHGVGAIHVDACRIGAAGGTTRSGQTPYAESGWRTGHEIVDIGAGRWPANVIHDGSDEVVGAFPNTGVSNGGGGLKTSAGLPDSRASGAFYDGNVGFGDSGSAARFFYSAKADANDRMGSKHPTVKPVELMRWLVRLVTPPGGTVLDPFAGTGTTGAAAFLEGFNAILIERESEYAADITRRMDLLLAGPDEKAHALTTPETVDALPLFGGAA